MGQHRRFPGGFLLIAAVLIIPSVLYGFVSAAESADECATVIKEGRQSEYTKNTGKKCE